MKIKRVYGLIAPILFIMELCSIILVMQNYNNKDKLEVYKTEKTYTSGFAMYKQRTDKTYEEINDTAFPTSGYLLNNEQSKCYGYDNKPITPIPVTQGLTKGSIDGRVTIESSNTIYCVLYFDLDNKVPEVNEFSITGKTSSGTILNNGYTYQTDNIPYTLEYVDTDVTQYCISNTSECTEWKEISEKTDTLTIDNSDGEKTMYIYLKDKANNVSVTTTKSTAKIIVDQTKPVINTFTLTGTADEGQQLSDSSQYTHTNNITYNATITESNISEYCVYEDNCSYTSLTSTTLTNQNYTLKDTEGSHTVNIRVKDKAGNESAVETKSITLDKTNPVATISSSSKDTSSITVTVGYSGNDSIIGRQCRISNGSWVTASNTNGSCTISNLKDGTQYTIEGRVRDASGRWNTTYPSVNVTTDKKEITGSYLYSNPPKGLTTTKLGGMKRFVGQCDAADGSCSNVVDNFVCFGYTAESECAAPVSENDYLYRIIGITSNGRMKLIKNKPLSGSFVWDSNSRSNITWPNSELFSKLNGNEFLTNLSSNWVDKIVLTSWLYGNYRDGLSTTDHNYDNETAINQYYVETGQREVMGGSGDPVGGSMSRWTLSAPGRVSLMTPSDFTFAAYGLGTKRCIAGVPCEKSWMHVGNNGCSQTYPEGLFREWTMVREGYVSEIFQYSVVAEHVRGGYATGGVTTEVGIVRPVFFLSPTTVISSGSGTSTDPYIISK